ncbi:unnamed protein product [Protopolystoma xenopodis]|uniref:Uncharacterized protein n=1 Tax=Protopolystoma xenopodis TaxID=117903 RepID=A0A3S5AWU2_9PLAT|nr:unnamed protein product [Protopolystoma xenopodis]
MYHVHGPTLEMMMHTMDSAQDPIDKTKQNNLTDLTVLAYSRDPSHSTNANHVNDLNEFDALVYLKNLADLNGPNKLNELNDLTNLSHLDDLNDLAYLNDSFPTDILNLNELFERSGLFNVTTDHSDPTNPNKPTDLAVPTDPVDTNYPAHPDDLNALAYWKGLTE